MQVGFAEKHGAGALQALDHGGVMVGHPVGIERRAAGREDAAGGVEILDRHRNTVQWAQMMARQDDARIIMRELLDNEPRAAQSQTWYLRP